MAAAPVQADEAGAGGGNLVCAILVNRAREIGFACLDLDEPRLKLTQFVDGHAYPNLLTLLEAHSPGACTCFPAKFKKLASTLLFAALVLLADHVWLR